MKRAVNAETASGSGTDGAQGGSRQKHPESDWEAWGGYMAAKVQKLGQQFEGDSNARVSDIFNGVAIFINGYTEPSADVLRRMVIENGGRFHTYYSSSATTHTIVSTLPKSKIDQLKPGEKVVLATWITESVAAGRRLADTDYLAYRAERGGGVAPPADAAFLRSYFARSRLHHLSTWGQELKRLVEQLKRDSDGHLDGRQRLRRADARPASAAVTERLVMHIDMDCFFVSVGIRNRPELADKAVVVTHAKANRGDGSTSDQPLQSCAEIACCSYAAREKGLKNGMLVGRALQLCPQLVSIEYDFDAYHDVSVSLYNLVASYTLDIEAVSCDELYAEFAPVCSDVGVDALTVVAAIRSDISRATGCPVSAGIGPNMLVARLATRRAKPNGVCFVAASDVASFMAEQELAHLPGIGRQTVDRLAARLGVRSMADLLATSRASLVAEFGPKSGAQMHGVARGVDDRSLKTDQTQKSVSCDVNYGIRFQTIADARRFIDDLSAEVEGRLKKIGARGRTVTLKLLTRAPGAPVEPRKYLGCGECVGANRSAALAVATDDRRCIAREVQQLFQQLSPVIADVRGVAARRRPIATDGA